AGGRGVRPRSRRVGWGGGGVARWLRRARPEAGSRRGGIDRPGGRRHLYGIPGSGPGRAAANPRRAPASVRRGLDLGRARGRERVHPHEGGDGGEASERVFAVMTAINPLLPRLNALVRDLQRLGLRLPPFPLLDTISPSW